MSTTQKVIQPLYDALIANDTVSSFQLRETSNTSLSGGFLNEKLGGIYRPIQSEVSSRISYKVEFNDGQSSNGGLSADTHIDEILSYIQLGKHQAAEPIVLASTPKVTPKVETFDTALAQTITNHPEHISEAVLALQKNHNYQEIDNVEGEISTQISNQRIINSSGFDTQTAGTRYSSYISLNDRIGFAHNSRSLQDPRVMQDYSNHYIEMSLKLEGKQAKLPSGNYPVMFSAGTGWQILGTFVLSNLRGSAVDAGQSNLTLKDFSDKKKIAHDNFTLRYNQLEDMHTRSFNYDGEGIPGQQFTLIENGSICEPICNLKMAKKLGYQPRSLGDTKTQRVDSTPYENFAKKHDIFLLSFGVLGLHSANSTTGRFSLPSDNVLVIKGGKVIGAANVVFSGDFFDVLKQPSTGFVHAPHLFDSPALTFETQVTVK